MMKKLISVISVIMILFVVGCAPDLNQVPEQNNVEEKSEFCFISGNVAIKLGLDISKIDMEPISVEKGSGDGFQWTVNKYDDIEIKTLLTDDNKNIINKISTQSPIYYTTRGIKAGDSVSKLTELYQECLTYSQPPENEYYVFEPEDDLGFKKIYFYIEDDSVNQIVIEDGIDG